MAQIIPFTTTSNITDFFIETPQLHNAVVTVLSDEQETMWQNNNEGDRLMIASTEAIYYSDYGEQAFLIESQGGTKLALGYLENETWEYRILDDKEQEQLTSFMNDNARKAPNIREIQPKRYLGFKEIMEEIVAKGCTLYSSPRDEAALWDNPDNDERINDVVSFYIKKHFENNSDSDPFVICNQDHDPVVICALLPKFQTILYENIPQEGRKQLRSFLDYGDIQEEMEA